MPKKEVEGTDPEFAAMSAVYAALKGLDSGGQARVLTYVAAKLQISMGNPEQSDDSGIQQRRDIIESRQYEDHHSGKQQTGDELEGISPVARKWMTRNSLHPKQLSALFSLGVDEIDLIANTVPGKKKKERMHNVFLLKGVAAYLGSGVARFTHEQLKEACLHYDAFDAANFAANFKSIASEVSGSKESGYTLNARGLAHATELVKSMTKEDSD